MGTITSVQRKKKKIKINVHLIEVEKDFGENSQIINEVRLGNIY